VIKVEKVNKKEKEIIANPCLANGLEVSKFEKFKASSEFLKEPLATELVNDTDHFTNDAVQLLKFHGSYQQDNRENRKPGGVKDWQMMLRLRSPAGRIQPNLYVALDNLSNKLGNGTLRATTRQAFQMHGIRKDNLKEVIQTIIKHMGSTLAACGDVNRNVMAPPAPYDTKEYKLARELAIQIADLLTPAAGQGTFLELWADGDLSYKIKPEKNVSKVRSIQNKGKVFSGEKKEPLYGKSYLPRKFKCAVTVPGDNSVDLLTNDIGLVVFANRNGTLKGCNFYIGGGMGRTHNNENTFARIADPLGYVPGYQVFELIQSIVAVQRDYGDRKNRKNSRMKYVLHDKGINWFKKTLIKNYFRKPIQDLRREPENKLIDYLGWHKQSEKYWFVGIPIVSGRISGNLKKALRDIVEKYQLDIRLTPNQDLLLCNIGSIQKQSVKRSLEKFGIINPGLPKEIERHALACPALPLCGLAMTEAERYLPQILDRIDKKIKSLDIEKTILIRITGCPNGCSRPYMAELALVGSGLNQYQLWLGGSKNLQRLAKPFLQRMKLEDLEKTLDPLLNSWKETEKDMDFGDHITTLGEGEVLKLLSKI
tara:strand:+ start:16539 stop:18323 length:1785 start_codon:yes stop_codon:yes gene_type:complete